jgi:hypothetical protein
MVMAGDHAPDIGVEGEGALAVGESPHSPRCVLADSGERSERRIVGRHEVAVMLGDACG